MRVLIAGCGEVGSVLASSLLNEGHVVYGLKRNVSGLPGEVRPIQADLLDPASLSRLPADIDTLVYMPTPGKRDQVAYENIFIHGLENLWRALKKEPVRTLLVSSTAVFGESKGGIVTELTCPEPIGFNGKVLLEMEQMAARLTRKLVVVRLSGIYGPGRERLIRMAASGNLEVQKAPAYFTNRIHRDDAAAVLKHLMEIKNPESLYLGTDNLPAPRYDVFDWLAKEQGKPAPKGLVDEEGSRGKRVSNQRLRESGFVFTYPDYRSGYGSIMLGGHKCPPYSV